MSDQLKGYKMTLAGNTFIVPTLTEQQKKALQREISIVSIPRDMQPDEVMKLDLKPIEEAALTIFHTAFVQNYPDITREDIEELLDPGNMGPLMAIVMGHHQGPGARA